VLALAVIAIGGLGGALLDRRRRRVTSTAGARVTATWT
jgi:hypothetical protein